MKKILLLFMVLFLNAQELKITSKTFNYYPNKLYSDFKGDVNVTKDKDNILADEIKVYLNKDKRFNKLIALGNVRFILNLDKNSTYKGKSDYLEYQVKSGNIILKNGIITKLQTNESIKGKYIKLNKFTKQAIVKGGNKPAVVVIKVKE